MKLPLNTSLKHHSIVGLLISLWLVLFLIFIAPFDVSDLKMSIRFIILPFYGVLCFGVYLMLIPIQNKIYKYYNGWRLSFECAFLLAFITILFFLCYIYYKTDIVNGVFDFKTFALEVYLPISLILMPFVIILRWFLNNKFSKKSDRLVTLKGENKLDILKILPEDLICISSADNYVEVNYLSNGQLHKKLLRNTLKAMQDEMPDLLKVHRSHLINPMHFKEWKGSNRIALTQIELPISKAYKTKLIDLI